MAGRDYLWAELTRTRFVVWFSFSRICRLVTVLPRHASFLMRAVVPEDGLHCRHANLEVLRNTTLG